MGGFLGIGGSSEKTDRGNQLAATQGQWNLFNYGLPVAQQMQQAGSDTLNRSLTTLSGAEQYYSDLLKPGRTVAAKNAAPAVNAVQAQSDKQREEEARLGTNRSGGTAAANREASTRTSSSIDDIISKTLATDQKIGAEGLTKVAGEKAAIGSTELANALGNLGLSESAVQSILSNATDSRKTSSEINQGAGAAVGSLIMAGLGFL